jgi:hypothetical protein
MDREALKRQMRREVMTVLSRWTRAHMAYACLQLHVLGFRYEDAAQSLEASLDNQLARQTDPDGAAHYLSTLPWLKRK